MPPLLIFCLHPHRNKQGGGLWVRVPQSSHPPLCYWSSHFTETDNSGQRSFRGWSGVRGGGFQRALHILRAGSGSLDKRDANRNTNTYRYSHKAALWRSRSKILFYLFFSFSFSKVNNKMLFFLHLYQVFTKTTLTFDKHLWHQSKRAKITQPVILLIPSFFLCFSLFVFKATPRQRSVVSLSLFAQTACQIMFAITASASAPPLIKNQSARNQPVLCAVRSLQSVEVHVELEWLSTARRKQDSVTGAMERGPWEETYPRGARGWVDSAQAAMEIKPEGAISRRY